MRGRTPAERLLLVILAAVAMFCGSAPGSSGSCVLNDAGEVVGIVEGGFPTDDKSAEGGFAVGVWGALIGVPK